MTSESSHTIRPGGVMRCCIDTWLKRSHNGEPPREGEKLPCEYCSSGLVYREGAWEWDRERERG